MGLMQMSVQGAVLIAVIVVVRAAVGDRLPRQTFLALWAVALARLTIPFSLPSAYSAYTAAEHSPVLREPLMLRVQAVPAPQHEGVPWAALWAIGAAAMAAWFILGYLHFWREFRFSLPVEEPFPLLWLEEHPLRRKVRLRRCGSISAPLTYGIFRPVILLPGKTDWSDTEQVRYILMHEMTHIRHFDTAWKLLAAAALCLHWFNPMAWVMCALFGRDLELACDACVVRQLGEPLKSSYAMALIRLEAQKSGLPPFCTGFSKTAIEERIRSIMSFRKMTFAAFVAAAVLVAGITVAFATTAEARTQMAPEDAAMLRQFQFPGYEDMTVAEFSHRAYLLLDEPEMHDWWAGMENAVEYMDNTNDPLCDFYMLLNQLIADPRVFRGEHGGAVVSDAPLDPFVLEYFYRIEISDHSKVTVREYQNAAGANCRDAIWHDMQQLLDTINDIDPGLLQEKMNAIFDKRSSDGLRFSLIEWSCQPMRQPADENAGLQRVSSSTDLTGYTEASDDAEVTVDNRFPPPTQADISSLLELKTPDYQSMTLEAFNQTLLEWMDADYERMERINGADAYLEDMGLSLTRQDLDFITLTVRASGVENGMMVRSHYTGQPEEDPCMSSKSLMRGNEGSAFWCDLYYELSYHITDKSKVMVGERDRCIGGFLRAVDDFWNNTPLEELARLDKAGMMAQLESIAQRHSSENIVISIVTERSGYEVMDERGIN